jgi:hypothetical protein
MTICLLGGECFGEGVEVFDYPVDCYIERTNQIKQGFPADKLSCMEILEDGTIASDANFNL